jgi:hypothetical protein
MRAPLAHDHTSWLLLVAIKRIVFSADCSPCCRRQGNDDSDIEFEEMVIDTSAEVCPQPVRVTRTVPVSRTARGLRDSILRGRPPPPPPPSYRSSYASPTGAPPR